MLPRTYRPPHKIVRAPSVSKIFTDLYCHEHLDHKTAKKWSRCTKNPTNSHDFKIPWSSLSPNITKLLRILAKVIDKVAGTLVKVIDSVA